ncbi:MAG: phosphatase PAP2 family protein [Thermoleophilia bacterium]
MPSPEITAAVLRADRRIGAATRARVAGIEGGPEVARLVANATGPAFQLLVGALLVSPGSRATGLRALAAGGLAAGIARAARDGIGRPRPGSRNDGGFPSRHAASATAIALVIVRDKPLLGTLALVAAGAGLAARVASADHEPLDIAAGAGLGAVVARFTRRRRRRRT